MHTVRAVDTVSDKLDGLVFRRTLTSALPLPGEQEDCRNF